MSYVSRATASPGSIPHERAGSGRDTTLILPPSTGPRGTTLFETGLSQHVCTLRYAQRGTPGGPALDGALSMAQLADDLAALLDALTIDASALVCHSTGCGIGISMATRYPDRVQSLVLVNPWSWGDPHLTSMQNLRIAAAASLDATQYARFNSAMLFPHDYRREHHDGFESLALQAKAPDVETFATRLEAILSFDARAHLDDVRCPTLVLGAKDDQLMPHWFATEIAAGINNSTLHLFDTGGHMLPETQGNAVLNRTLTFLN